MSLVHFLDIFPRFLIYMETSTSVAVLAQVRIYAHVGSSGSRIFFFQARYPAELLSVNWHMQDFLLSFLFFRVTWVRACVSCLNLP